jgi:hypothetical protein
LSFGTVLFAEKLDITDESFKIAIANSSLRRVFAVLSFIFWTSLLNDRRSRVVGLPIRKVSMTLPTLRV